MNTAVIRATGLFTPEASVSNAELVSSYNSYAKSYNDEHQNEIQSGKLKALLPSSVEFIEKASGIEHRYVMDKEGVLNIQRMMPYLPKRKDTDLSLLAEIGIKACEDALDRAGRSHLDIDGVIVACSNLQRGYPAIAIEIQQGLGIKDGFGYDMNVACSSATFGIQAAADQIRCGHARAILVVNPEVTSGHLNWRDRDSHFIFGDVATCTLIERGDFEGGGWKILGSKLKTKFSNNIRNNFGFLNRAEEETCDQSSSSKIGPKDDKLFVQEGRKVFKEVVPMVSDMISVHMKELELCANEISRIWLHQANIHMNLMIAKKIFGREAGGKDAPIILNEYANTSSAGSIIAFHKHSDDLVSGNKGLICSFGAGYSAGTIFVEKL